MPTVITITIDLPDEEVPAAAPFVLRDMADTLVEGAPALTIPRDRGRITRNGDVIATWSSRTARTLTERQQEALEALRVSGLDNGLLTRVTESLRGM